jgi:dephospho-CoA kinase
MRVGLTGGLASGKSIIGRELERLGCILIRMDELGHQVLAPDGEAYLDVVAEFGFSILGPDQAIDRATLAALVFNDPARLEVLNALVHPHIRSRARALRLQAPSDAIVVTEAAILIETGSHRDCEILILAVCTPEQQLERALARGLSAADAQARMARQMSNDEKKTYADFVIDTSLTLEDTLAQTAQVHEKLKELMLCG